MSEKSLRFYSWWTPGLGVAVWHYWVRVHGSIALSRSFTTLGECGVSLSLGLRLIKTHS